MRRSRSIERMFRMRRAQGGYSPYTKALITCTRKGAEAYRAGVRASANPYVSPEHNWAWREGWEGEKALAYAGGEQEALL